MAGRGSSRPPRSARDRVPVLGCARPLTDAHTRTRPDYLMGLTVSEVDALLEQVENRFFSVTALL